MKLNGVELENWSGFVDEAGVDVDAEAGDGGDRKGSYCCCEGKGRRRMKKVVVVKERRKGIEKKC